MRTDLLCVLLFFLPLWCYNLTLAEGAVGPIADCCFSSSTICDRNHELERL